jgi:hypothetical protein
MAFLHSVIVCGFRLALRILDFCAFVVVVEVREQFFAQSPDIPSTRSHLIGLL